MENDERREVSWLESWRRMFRELIFGFWSQISGLVLSGFSQYLDIWWGEKKQNVKFQSAPGFSHKIPPRGGDIIGRNTWNFKVSGCRKKRLWSTVVSGMKSGSGTSRSSSSLCNIAATERRWYLYRVVQIPRPSRASLHSNRRVEIPPYPGTGSGLGERSSL